MRLAGHLEPPLVGGVCLAVPVALPATMTRECGENPVMVGPFSVTRAGHRRALGALSRLVFGGLGNGPGLAWPRGGIVMQDHALIAAEHGFAVSGRARFAKL